MSKDSDQTATAPTGAPMVYPGKEKRGQPTASGYVEAAACMRVTACYSGAADDLRLADEMLAQARTKQLPSSRTEIGAGGELIDREKVGSYLVDTVAHPDYVTAEASCDRLALASQAGSLSLALDAADTIQAPVGRDERLGLDIDAPFIVWHPNHVELTANEAMQAATGQSGYAKREAREFLLEHLQAGPVKADDMVEEAKQNGITLATLRRVKKDLQIKSRKTPGKFDGAWTWELPATAGGMACTRFG